MENMILLKAALYAARKHLGQTRKGENSAPYINHPIEVASFIAEIGGIENETVLAAALLHDTVEDTDAKAEELQELFGEEVTSIVLEVTDDKSLPKLQRKQLQVEQAVSLSPEAKLIRIADKISNIQDITYSPPKRWSKKRREKYLDWAEKVVGQCNNTNPALEKHFSAVLKEGRKKFSKNHK
jgi:GTP diphosphokinase / guanosine-3',5'-bis(diphosphate) 3'-diphosphatase